MFYWNTIEQLFLFVETSNKNTKIWGGIQINWLYPINDTTLPVSMFWMNHGMYPIPKSFNTYELNNIIWYLLLKNW